MRNLKRALSLVMASVMLLGMMVIGTSAAGTTFTDDKQIVNSEAAAITGGLGIFSGYGDGSFGAKNIVTRAEMATIVVKMLYGADYNADPFKGGSKFSDVADYQGGWAEGYVNLCASLGIIKGYGDGTFKPGNTLTTAEAITFIINALGIDAGNGDWPVTVMSKATELGLFGELTLATNAGLTRDDLSVLVYEGLTYTPDAGKVWTVGAIEFDTLNDALIYCAIMNANLDQNATPYEPTQATNIKGSLAEKVFKLEKETIVITGNSYSEVQYGGDAVKTTEGIAWADRTLTTWAEREAAKQEWYIETNETAIGTVADIYWFDKDGQGDYDKLTEKVYCMITKSKPVFVNAALDKQTPAQVKALFGLKNTPAVANAKTPFYFFSYNDISYTEVSGGVHYNTVSGSHKDVLTVDTGKLDVAKGTYYVYDGELVSTFASSGRIVPYYLSNPTKGDGKYTLYDLDDTAIRTEYDVEKNPNRTTGVIVNNFNGTDSFNSVINIKDIDFDNMTTGTYVYVSNFTGEKRSLVAPSVMKGTMTKFDGTANANGQKIWINGTQYNIQPNPYDDDILTALTVKTGYEAQHMYGKALGTGNGWEFANNSANYSTEYEFIYAGSYIFAYRPIAPATPTASLIVPVYKYTETEKDTSYGGNAETTTHWVQAVDMDGKEVILQVTADQFNAQALADTDGVINTKAFFKYTTSYNSTLKATVATFSTDGIVSGAVTENATAITKSVTDGTNRYYINDGFKVMYISGSGKTLKVTIKDGAYTDLTATSLVYGEKLKSTDTVYDLKYKLVDGAYSAGSTTGTELLFNANANPGKTGSSFTGLMTSPVSYKDSTGAAQVAYNVSFYIDGVKTSVMMTADEINANDTFANLNRGADSVSSWNCFYTYTVSPEGLYDVTQFTGDDTYAVVTGGYVTNYNGLLTVTDRKWISGSAAGNNLVYEDITIADMDVSEAKVINVITANQADEDATKLSNKYRVSVLYNKTTGKAEVIYVTNYNANGYSIANWATDAP